MAVALEIVRLPGGRGGRGRRNRNGRPADAVDPQQIGVGEGQVFDRRVDGRERIKGLFMLAPGHIADKALVAEHEPLAAERELGVEVGSISYLQPVQRRHRRIDDDGDRRSCRCVCCCKVAPPTVHIWSKSKASCRLFQ